MPPWGGRSRSARTTTPLKDLQPVVVGVAEYEGTGVNALVHADAVVDVEAVCRQEAMGRGGVADEQAGLDDAAKSEAMLAFRQCILGADGS